MAPIDFWNRRLGIDLKGYIGEYVGQVGVLVLGSLGQQALILASLPVLTRLYTPGDFGILAVYTACLSIGVPLATLRYELVVPLPKSERTAVAALLAAGVSVTVMATCLMVVVLVAPERLAGILGVSEFAPVAWLLPLGLFAVGWYQALSYWAIRTEAFGLIARTKLWQAGWQITIQGATGVVGLGPAGLLAGDAAGRGGGAFWIVRSLKARVDARLMRQAVRRMWPVSVHYRRFPQLATAAGIMNSLGVQIPAILMAALYGPGVAGLYAIASRVVGGPMSLIGRAVAQVYVGELARMGRLARPRRKQRKLFVRRIVQLLKVGIGPILLIAIVAPHGFSLLFGPEWEEAGVFARYLAPMFLAQFIVSPVSQTLLILERQGWQFAWDLWRFLLVLTAFGLGYHFDWPAHLLVIVLSTLMALAYASLLILNHLILGKEHRRADRGSAE